MKINKIIENHMGDEPVYHKLICIKKEQETCYDPLCNGVDFNCVMYEMWKERREKK